MKYSRRSKTCDHYWLAVEPPSNETITMKLEALEAGYADKAAALMLHHLAQSQSQSEAA